MGRIANIFTKVRDSLADPDAKRYSNDRILRLIDEGQKDIAIHAKLLRSRVDVAIIAGENTYTIPDAAFDLSRVVELVGDATDYSINEPARHNPLPILSHTQMDERFGEWEGVVGSPIQAIVFDKQDSKHFKIYPIPEEGDAVNAYSIASPYGVLTGSTDDLVDTYGVLTDISTTSVFTKDISSPYGIVTDMSSYITTLAVYYRRRPATLDDYSKIDDTQVLEVDEIFDKAIKHYVVGMALRDDNDAEHRQKGLEELTFYEREMSKVARPTASSNYTAASPNSSQYDNGFKL